MEKTRIVIVDVETTGLEFGVHQVTEIAWKRLDTNEVGCFVPPHSLENADPQSLEISEYWERLQGKPFASHNEIYNLWLLLGGDGTKTTLAGVNPRFDALFLSQLFKKEHLTPPNPWKSRLLDIGALGYALLPVPEGHMPSLAELSEMFEIENSRPHSAESDVHTTAVIYERLMVMKSRNLKKWTED